MCHFDEEPKGTILDRRKVIGLMGAGATTFFLGLGGSAAQALVQDNSKSAGQKTGKAVGTPVNCVAASPELTIGPFFVEEKLNRTDVRTDSKTKHTSVGVPLELEVNLVKLGSTCYAIDGATVDIWHCDAAGLYSDVGQNGTRGQDFLRGYQVSNKDGKVKFTTIYPGWYFGRCVHIHLRVRLANGNDTYDFTSQMFFDEKITDSVHGKAPYNTRGQRDTLNTRDGIYSQGGNTMLLALTKTEAGYKGVLNLGLMV